MKNEELDKVKPDLKSQNSGYGFAKKFASGVAALSMSAAMVFGLVACQNTPTPDPVNPNPPIVTPPDPDKPNPPNPDDDKEKEEEQKTKAAIDAAEKFIADMASKQNFTVAQSNMTIAYANGQTKIAYENAENLVYYYQKDNVSYKVFNADDAWKQIEEENAKPIADYLNKFNNLTWEDKLEDGYACGSKETGNGVIAVSIKVENGVAKFSYAVADKSASGTISEVGTTSFEIPEITPEEEPIDWDNLTDAQLAEFTPVMVENIKTTLAKNIRPNIGNTGVLNKIFAIDFDGNNLILGLDYTNNTNGNRLGLYSYPLKASPCLKALYQNDFSAASSNPGSSLISFNYNNYSADNLPRVQQCFTKLANDGLINISGNENFLHMITGGTGPDTTLHCGATDINLYKIDNKSIKYITLSVRSDGNTKDFINDYLLNGTLNETYRKLSQEFEYSFTDKALYNFAGLEKTISQEQQN